MSSSAAPRELVLTLAMESDLNGRPISGQDEATPRATYPEEPAHAYRTASPPAGTGPAARRRRIRPGPERLERDDRPPSATDRAVRQRRGCLDSGAVRPRSRPRDRGALWRAQHHRPRRPGRRADDRPDRAEPGAG